MKRRRACRCREYDNTGQGWPFEKWGGELTCQRCGRIFEWDSSHGYYVPTKNYAEFPDDATLIGMYNG